MFEIKSGVPIPPYSVEPPHKKKYPWDLMEVGDCFEVPVPLGSTARTIRNRMQNAGNRWCKKNEPDNAITARKLSDELVGIWKITRKSLGDRL